MKLISMTDFVLDEIKSMVEESKGHIPSAEKKYIRLTSLYAKFLKQPLTLGMFVPCDEDGNIIEEPMYDPANAQYYESHLYAYHNAKDRVLFEGFYIQTNFSKKENKTYRYVRNKFPHVFSIEQLERNTVESLLTGYKKHLSIILTQSAIKQIGL